MELEGSLDGKDDFLDHLYEVTSYGELNRQFPFLEDICHGFEGFLKFMVEGRRLRRLYIIEEVRKEWGVLQEAIRTKQKYLNQREKRSKNGKKENESESKELFSRLGEIVNDILKEAQHLIYRQVGKEYSFLEKLFKAFRFFHVNPGTRYYNFIKGRGTLAGDYLFTDEKLVALAYYLALFKGKRAGILTRDFGMVNLFVMGSLLIYSALSDMGARYKNLLQRTPVELYYFPKYRFDESYLPPEGQKLVIRKGSFYDQPIVLISTLRITHKVPTEDLLNGLSEQEKQEINEALKEFKINVSSINFLR